MIIVDRDLIPVPITVMVMTDLTCTVLTVPLNRCFRYVFFLSSRTGYVKHLANYKCPVQNSPAIRVGQEGTDNIDLSEKVVVITGANR